MRGKRRVIVTLLTAVLCLGLFLPLPAQAADLYFTSINDRATPLTADTMPFWSGGLLYVPYSVFDKNLNEISVDLGLSASYGRNGNTVTIYSTRQMLTFDLTAGNCRDELSGEVFSSRAIMRNSRPFVPLGMVCSFFGLQYSYNAVPYIPQAYLVRIKNSDVVLDDATFIDAASNLLNMRLRAYTQSLNPGESTSPSTNSGTATTQPEEPVSPTNIPTYLAVRCGSAEGLSTILSALDSAGRYAVFFLTPQLLEEESDLVRQIIGTGHSIGILAEGDDVDQTRLLLEQGNRVLEKQVLSRSTLAYVPKDQQDALTSEGWVCWNETLLLSPSDTVGAVSFANSTINRLNGRMRATYLTLEGGANGGRVLSRLLRQLNEQHFILQVPIETML